MIYAAVLDSVAGKYVVRPLVAAQEMLAHDVDSRYTIVETSALAGARNTLVNKYAVKPADRANVGNHTDSDSDFGG